MDQHAFAYSEEYVKPTSGERAEFEIRNALEAFRNARPEHALKVRFSIACFTLCLAIHRSLGCRRVCRVINFPIKTYSVFIWIREGELELVSAQLWGKFDESGFGLEGLFPVGHHPAGRREASSLGIPLQVNLRDEFPD
mmetsp:Transcript_39536/g.157022  ORF Transcript_39536/g.157022 Transcript_39536/m.157022 type:complete len:139 (-) Transcript_39536:1082-1498(-)